MRKAYSDKMSKINTFSGKKTLKISTISKKEQFQTYLHELLYLGIIDECFFLRDFLEIDNFIAKNFSDKKKDQKEKKDEKKEKKKGEKKEKKEEENGEKKGDKEDEEKKEKDEKDQKTDEKDEKKEEKEEEKKEEEKKEDKKAKINKRKSKMNEVSVKQVASKEYNYTLHSGDQCIGGYSVDEMLRMRFSFFFFYYYLLLFIY